MNADKLMDFNLSNLSSQVSVNDRLHVTHSQDRRSDITVVWLEKKSSIDINQARLLNVNNRCSLICFSNISKCLKYLKRTRSRDYVIMIIVCYSLETIQRLIYLLGQNRLVQTIFVVGSYCDGSDYLPLFSDSFRLFSSRRTLFNVLQKRIEQVDKHHWDSGIFTTFYRKEKAMKDVQQNLATFVWTHVYKVLLTKMSREDLQDKCQMLSECRAYYRHDKTQLDHLKTFQCQYQSKDVIHCEDMWNLYAFRYIIIDLHHRLEELSQSQNCSSIRVYRGTKLNRDELEQFQVGNLVSTNAFLSCSTNRKVSEMFISTNNNRLASQQSVLFLIDVDRRISPKTIFADVSHQSVFPDENEVIFTFGSTFLIDEINFDKRKCIWVVRMSATSNKNALIDQYEKYILERLQFTDPTILYAHALANISSNFGQALSYFHRLLRILPVDHLERPNIYYNLGRLYHFLDKSDKSLHYFRCARLLIRRLLPERIFDYCRILRGLGLVYLEMRDSNRAIQWLEQALILHNKSFSNNHTELPFHLNRLAYGYFQATNYHRALEVLHEAERFFLRKMPVNHQGYGQTLHITGLVHRALGDDSKALIAFEDAVKKQHSFLSVDHPRLASTYYQLSLLHADHNHNELALDCIQKALKIQLIKLPPSHSQLRLSKELLQRLR
ncbi:unnamed protein product [Adineta ricciae]|uniref:NAD(P)(+)--arginine ADP-ribosyltransferase n=1 Tax=Adineta ricciae TaxID=249248 RepID=A0A815W102_ADIRI|nr:unnamed protein product [Adineta ricciae]